VDSIVPIRLSIRLDIEGWCFYVRGSGYDFAERTAGANDKQRIQFGY
jgi:hypothetical protein